MSDETTLRHDGEGLRATALALLNEQTIAANICRYVAEQLVAIVVDRMAVLRVTPETFEVTMETLRTNMHGEVDRLIDEAVTTPVLRRRR